MRVIGGEFRSRALKSVPGLDTRPTPDRLRETLFDILQTQIAGTVFLDAYAGSGAVGIEALSRGAKEAIFIENSRRAADVIHQNLKSLGIDERAEVITGKVLTALPRVRPDIAFLDPPYEAAAEYAAALHVLAENPPQIVVVQHSKRTQLKSSYAALTRYREVKQGDNQLSFFFVSSVSSVVE